MRRFDFMQLPFKFKSNPLAYSLLLTHVHFFLALFLLSIEPMGRYRLARELSLTPALTRTFLTKLEQKGLLTVTNRRRGHRLTCQGKKLLQKYLERFVPLNEGFAVEKIVIGKMACLVLLRRKFFRQNMSVLDVRDQAVRQHASSATVLEISREGLVFAHANPKDPFYHVNLALEIERKIYFQNPHVGDWVLFVGADDFFVAREAAIRAALFATKCEEVLQEISVNFEC